MLKKPKTFGVPYKETEFGFDWGAASVTRVASIVHNGGIVLSIETPKEILYARVTRTGLIRTDKITKDNKE